MTQLITDAMFQKLLPHLPERFKSVEWILSELGIDPLDQLRAMQNGHPIEASITTGISLEKILQVMWRRYHPDIEPQRDQLSTFIYGLRDEINNKRIIEFMHAIRLTRNRASHVGDGVTMDDALDSLAKLFSILQWYGQTQLHVKMENMNMRNLEVSFDTELNLVDHSERYLIQVVSMLSREANDSLQTVILSINDLQDKYAFNLLNNDELANEIKLNTYQRDIHISPYLDMVEKVRAERHRFEDRVMVFVENYLIGTVYENLFTGRRSESCVGVVTTHDVEGKAMPEGTIGAYFVYMMAKAAIDCMNPEHEHHTDKERNFCIYDYKLDKQDIVKSMCVNALCDQCRDLILNGDNLIDAGHYHALDKMFEYSGTLLNQVMDK